MTNEQKVEILEREVKRLTEYNIRLKEENERYVQMTQEGTYQLIQKYIDGYKEIIERLEDEEKKYNDLNRSLLHIKNNYILDMSKFFLKNKVKYKQ